MKEHEALEVADLQQLSILELYRRAVVIDRLFIHGNMADKRLVFIAIAYLDKFNSIFDTPV